MKGVSSRISKSIVPGARIDCVDNSGAILFKMIHIVGKGSRKGRMSAAGVSDVVIASAVKSSPAYLKKPVRVLIIRQKDEIRRANGMRLKFEDNAGIMIGEDNLPIATEVKGAMAREVVEKFVKVAGVASRVI